MADASTYPVTLGYKSTQPPYGTTLRPYHRGIDYGCPAGTPVVVNGVKIGLSGATGFVTGAHLHVGRFVGGIDTNPAGGFTFNSAVVTEVGYDANNGNFVRIQGDGASWVYCHLNSTNVTKGQTLKGGDMPDKINTNTSRILSHGIIARNGVAGRTYSLDGSQGDPWLGADLTNAFIQSVFDSPEAKQWRDSGDANSVHGINASLARIPVLEKQVADLKAQLANAPTSGGLTAEQAAQLSETNSIVKQIWAKLTGIFK